MMKDQKSLIKQFEQVGKETIEEAAVSETSSTMLEVFQAYPKSWFTQRNFVDVLKRQNGIINKHLNKLHDNGLIERKGSRRQYFYKLADKSAPSVA